MELLQLDAFEYRLHEEISSKMAIYQILDDVPPETWIPQRVLLLNTLGAIAIVRATTPQILLPAICH